MKLPTKEECFEIIEEYKVFDNIKEHIKQVNKIAVFLSKKLKEKGINVDIDVVDRASLLHDIAKTIDIGNDPRIKKDPKFYKKLKNRFPDIKHEEAVSIILKEKGYEELGKVAKQHGFKSLGNHKTWEQKILVYSDARVAHDKIVNLKERLDDVCTRYTNLNINDYDPDFRKKHEVELGKIEKEIFAYLDFKPEDLKEEIKKVE
jgi:uncharacterized protein